MVIYSINWRRIIPYLLVAPLFGILFWLSMVVPVEYFFWQDEKRLTLFGVEYKTPTQHFLFIFLLPFVLASINLLEITTTKRDQFLIRMAKSIITLFLSFALAFKIDSLLDVQAINIFRAFLHPHGGGIECMISFVLLLVSVFLLELIKLMWVYLFKRDKQGLNRFVPKGLRMESSG